MVLFDVQRALEGKKTHSYLPRTLDSHSPPKEIQGFQ